MSALDDAIAAAAAAVADLQTSVDAAVTRSTTDVANFNQQISDLNAQIAALQAQQPTPANLQAIADLQTQIAALKGSVDGIDPTSPVVIPPDQLP